ncbi:Eco57I restriction-modification methylase domain-containing protein [Xylanivirga thermophila]|uniref:Eco57I restriction-modification methylase domain-containing protein n=1 Tax=Xylanivirga thermophila TaxID=2496273 RepID=UPI00101D6002|nr:TaqI-like C-terminal specificity domain-containing protein [Xylanivirga thermophila]
MEAVRFNKDALIDELKQIHKDMVSVYMELFKYKYDNNEEFRNFIEKEYRDNSISKDDKDKWNENFCHRTSYTLINKVLFIRICEDKGFMFNPEEDFIMGEPKDPNIGKKLSARGRDKWISLISNYTLGELLKFAFADMKESFKNIALFKEDKYEKLNPTKQELELKFILDSKEYGKTPVYSYEENVAKIIEKLDTSKFDFNVPTEGNILGDVYEKFMDRETRKAIGQFYTPDFVIEYILNNTVTEADVVENPFVSVLDPACGSGHFLIMAYDILRNKFEENIDKLRGKYADADYIYKNENIKGKEYWIKDRIHYHILKHCIFGADIDSFAVQLTTINLLLKDLDNFIDELNIMECDSLIKWEDDYDWKDLKQQLKDCNRLYYTINYKDIAGIYRQDDLSWNKADELVRLCEFWARKYDYIVGNPPYITVLLGRGQGKVIAENIENYYKEIYFNSVQYKINLFAIFLERGIMLAKEKISFIVPSSILTNYYFEKIRKYILNSTWIDSIFKLNYDVFESAITGGNVILNLKVNKTVNGNSNLMKTFEVKNLCDYLTRNYKISEFCQDVFLQIPSTKFLIDIDIINVILSIQKESRRLGDIAVFYNGIKTGDNKRFLSKEKKGPEYKPVIRGRDIFKYQVNNSTIYVLFDKDKLWSNTNESMYLVNKKIIVRQTSDCVIAALDDKQRYTMDTTHLIIPENTDDIFCLLGILNSKLMDFYYKQIVPELDKPFAEVKIANLKELPIKLEDRSKINKITNNVRIIIEKYDLINKLEFDMKKCIKYIKTIGDVFPIIDKIEKTLLDINILQNIIDNEVVELYGIDTNNTNKIIPFSLSKCRDCKKNNEYKKVFSDLEQIISPNKLIEEHSALYNNKTIGIISEEYGFEYYDIYLLRKKYAHDYGKDEPWEFYNLSDLYIGVNEYLKNETIEILKQKNKYISLDDIRNILEEELSNFNELMNIMRKDNPTKKSKDIVKEALNEFADTWNRYTKNINADKEPKELVKYYDSNYYGLSKWDDEIHKEYFIDAIKEYTEINPNEKKARDILNLFEELNIKDKEDYIEVLNGQIKKVFRR